jgi:hypothetical protein
VCFIHKTVPAPTRRHIGIRVYRQRIQICLFSRQNVFILYVVQKGEVHSTSSTQAKQAAMFFIKKERKKERKKATSKSQVSEKKEISRARPVAGAEPPNRGSNWLIRDIYLCPKSCRSSSNAGLIAPGPRRTSVKQQRSFARSRSPKTHLLKRTCASNFHRERQMGGGGGGRQRACVVSCARTFGMAQLVDLLGRSQARIQSVGSSNGQVAGRGRAAGGRTGQVSGQLTCVSSSADC